MAAQVSFSSYQQSPAVGTWDSGPVDFKQFLLAALNDPCEIMELLSERKPPWGEVVILQFEGIKYELVRDAEALPRLRFQELDDEIIYCYFQLKYKRDKKREVLETFSSMLPKHAASAQLDGDIFLPIGSVTESQAYRDEGYVCMLNLSTNPISMWAVYDYFHDSNRIICEYAPMTRARSVMWGSDLILLYEDIKDWHPHGGSVTPWKSPGKEMYALGNMLRGHTVFPPEELLEAVTQGQESDNAVKEGGDDEYAAEIAEGSPAQNDPAEKGSPGCHKH